MCCTYHVSPILKEVGGLNPSVRGPVGPRGPPCLLPRLRPPEHGHDEVDDHAAEEHGLDDGEELLGGGRLVLLALGRHLVVQDLLRGKKERVNLCFVTL